MPSLVQALGAGAQPIYPNLYNTGPFKPYPPEPLNMVPPPVLPEVPLPNMPPPAKYQPAMYPGSPLMAPLLGATWTPIQEDLLRIALIDTFGDNGPDFLLETRDVGIPQSGQSGSKQDFNYLNGQIV